MEVNSGEVPVTQNRVQTSGDSTRARGLRDRAGSAVSRHRKEQGLHGTAREWWLPCQ